MKILKIEDIFDVIRNGATIQQSPQAKGIPITRIETTSNDRFNRDKLGYANIFDLKEYQKYILQDNDLLMSHINSEKYLGRTVLYKKISDETIIHGMNLLLLRVNQDIANPCYMNYYFKSDEFKRKVAKMTKKSVNQASFNINLLKSIELKLPTLEEQVEIYMKLDKICLIIDKKQQQLNRYDELVKSQFIEMFGDSKTTESVRLKDIAQIITGSTPSMAVKDYYKSKDIRFYKPSDLINDINNLKDSDYWISEEARTVARIVPPNSILVSCIGTVGKIGITNTESTCNQQINAILPNKKFNHIYLAYNIATIKEKLQHIAKAPVVPIINKTTFGNIEIKFETNIELQNQFADFVKHIDKLKFTIKQSIEKLELCYKSLMKQYFD